MRRKRSRARQIATKAEAPTAFALQRVLQQRRKEKASDVTREQRRQSSKAKFFKDAQQLEVECDSSTRWRRRRREVVHFARLSYDNFCCASDDVFNSNIFGDDDGGGGSGGGGGDDGGGDDDGDGASGGGTSGESGRTRNADDEQNALKSGRPRGFDRGVRTLLPPLLLPPPSSPPPSSSRPSFSAAAATAPPVVVAATGSPKNRRQASGQNEPARARELIVSRQHIESARAMAAAFAALSYNFKSKKNRCSFQIARASPPKT